MEVGVEVGASPRAVKGPAGWIRGTELTELLALAGTPIATPASDNFRVGPGIRGVVVEAERTRIGRQRLEIARNQGVFAGGAVVTLCHVVRLTLSCHRPA